MDAFKRICLALIICTSSFSHSICAADDTAEIKREISQLKDQLQNLEMRVAVADQTKNTNYGVSQNVQNKKKLVKKINTTQKHEIITQSTTANNASHNATIPNDPPVSYKTPSLTSQENISPTVGTPFSWQGPDISALIAGGASAGYSKPATQNGSFNLLDFNPILLFDYKDLVFLRSALDFSLDDQGNTQISLDYMNINLLFSNYAVFGVGKFDSGLGYFIQNLSPAWINKLADAPVGFSDDQAAPHADVGMRLQGGFPLFNDAKANYILYISNGPQGSVDTTNVVINHIATDGYTKNYGNYVIGGRLGFLPIPKLEIGISAAGGKLVLLDGADGVTVLQRGRHYNALGADISYKWNNLDLRGEIIQQQVSSQVGSIVPQAEKWKAWYLQAAYRLPSTNFEPVVRYGKFTASIANQQEGQVALGLDYWFAPSVAAQAEYEINHGPSGSGNDLNLALIQLVFGF